MSEEKRELLEKLKFELAFVEDGGYGRSVRTPHKSDYFRNALQRNFGWRIDHVLATASLADRRRIEDVDMAPSHRGWGIGPFCRLRRVGVTHLAAQTAAQRLLRVKNN